MPKISSLTDAPLLQVAALPWRWTADGRVEVCLITTRETRRWTIPKGWRMKGQKNRAAARIEAEQEAGVSGKPERRSIGEYTYWKRRADRFDYVRVEVFALEVTRSLERWAERGQRDLLWASPEDAAVAVDEPGLATVLRRFGAAHAAPSKS